LPHDRRQVRCSNTCLHASRTGTGLSARGRTASTTRFAGALLSGLFSAQRGVSDPLSVLLCSASKIPEIASAQSAKLICGSAALSMFSPSAPIEAISLQGQLDLVANSDSSFLLAPPSGVADDRYRLPFRNHQQAITLLVQIHVKHAVPLSPHQHIAFSQNGRY
jgi:hypothetical protein